jgi:stage II sporulation protein AA (anti-sigma F factor antagonist)
MTSLHCSTSKHGALTVVAATGEIDLATAETLWDELRPRLTPASALALDCTGITFIDSMGLQVLMRAHRYAAEQQASFALVGANVYVNRVLELAGLIGFLPYFTDGETARASLAPSVD